MVAAAPNMPTIDQFYAANPNAPPEDMLRVVLAETERLNAQIALASEKNLAREHEFKIAAEVALDDRFQPVPKTLAQAFRVARMYVDGGCAPKAYLESPQPVPAVTVAILYARRCGVDDLAFLHNSFPVNGKIGIESKLAMSMLIKSGKIVGRPKYEIGPTQNGRPEFCTCTVTDAESGIEYSQTVTWAQVEAEGWHNSKGGQKSKWLSLPELMFQYRSGVFVMRVHYPDVLVGMITIEELEDIGASTAVPNGSGTSPSGGLAELSERMGAAPKTATKAPRKPEPPVETEQEVPVETAKSPEVELPAPPVEDKKPATKSNPRVTEGSETTTKLAAPVQQPAREPRPNALQLKGFIDLTYTDADLADFDVEKIIQSCVGVQEHKRLIDAILARKHPDHADYLKPELRPVADTSEEDSAGSDDVSQEPEEASGEENQDIPAFISAPVKRPKLGLMASDNEKEIIGKRNPEMIRRYLVNEVEGKDHPHLSETEQQYLLSLGQRRAYQLEHDLPRTDSLPK